MLSQFGMARGGEFGEGWEEDSVCMEWKIMSSLELKL